MLRNLFLEPSSRAKILATSRGDAAFNVADMGGSEKNPDRDTNGHRAENSEKENLTTIP